MDYPRWIDLSEESSDGEVRVLNPRYMREKMSTERVLSYYKQNVRRLPARKIRRRQGILPQSYEDHTEFEKRVIDYKETVKEILDNGEHVD
mgnify:CR=1 FL=1